MALIRACPYCDGNPGGCEECGHTGQRVTTYINAGDGIEMRVSGSAVLSDEGQKALAEVARAAMAHVEATS